MVAASPQLPDAVIASEAGSQLGALRYGEAREVR
ncbi:protein of unknown function [Streptantibioticus cattleyicolor NRRL 8057 = DSM 46488]|nr:protein of unknown function [Streptantibioticus cattleyicolor NRRL 8057 = DSM 46488]